jgi:hypothetical protein
MAKHTAQKGRPGTNGSTDPTQESPESLDQVRDILFGGQMRMVDARLRGLEERVAHEQAVLRNEFTRALADFESASKKEFASQAERLNAERTKRIEDLKALGAELKEALKSLDRRHQKLEEAAAQADAELRDQLLRQTTGLAADLSRTSERITAELERSAAALRTEKLDTAAFANTLTEIAARLTGNGRGTSKGAAKG